MEGNTFLEANILKLLFALPASPEPQGVKIPIPKNSLFHISIPVKSFMKEQERHRV